ncbi:MAG: serine hydrolase [Devosia sp.]|nr:serine hydrolase [Devosia sp.]
MPVDISGSVSPGFEVVADAFAASFTHPDMGAAVSVYLGGRPVVDLWGGMADPLKGTRWTADTLSVIFSCTKGLMSLLVAQLVEEGLLDHDAPVARYWPEFAAAGKASITVRQALAHQAGLSAPRRDLTLDAICDWDQVVHVLEAQAPLWPPGHGYAYHALTHGWLTGELVRRVTGLAPGEAFQQRIARPLAADAWIGLPQSEHRRVSHLTVGATLANQIAGTPAPAKGSDAELDRAMTLGGALPPALATRDGGFNDPRLWAAQIPAAGGITNARSLARIWSAAVLETAGVRLLRPATVERATKVESQGEPVFHVPPPWPKFGMGFLLDCDTRRLVTPHGFGHDGAGGQIAFAEPTLGLSFAYVTNLMEGAGDTRGNSVVDALRRVPQVLAGRDVDHTLV